MIIAFSNKFRILLFFLILVCGKLSAQENFTGYINPEVSLKLNNETPWSYQFGIAQRDIVYYDIEDRRNFREEIKFQGQFIELNHYTSRSVGKYGKITGGVRYRFIEIYTKKHNEIRFSEQYTHTHNLKKFALAHRLRLAQRFRGKNTFRTRYRFSFIVPLNPQLQTKNHKKLNLATTVEGVWEFGKEETPNYGIRYSNYLNYAIFKDTSINFGLEYRYRDFTRNPYTQIFLVSALKVSL